MKNSPKTLLIVLIVIIVGSLLIVNLKKDRQSKYYNEAIGLRFNYPKAFALEERRGQGDSNQPYIVILTKPNNRILLVPSLQSTTTVQMEKEFYEGILFKDPNQLNNSRIKFGEYEGFKSISNSPQSLITVYRSINTSSSLILRGELTASSSPELLELEETFKTLLQNSSVESTK